MAATKKATPAPTSTVSSIDCLRPTQAADWFPGRCHRTIKPVNSPIRFEQNQKIAGLAPKIVMSAYKFESGRRRDFI
jgi:hypothetical protein